MNIILSLMLTLMPVPSPLQQLRALMGQTKENSSVSIKDLRKAPTMVVIDNRSLHLSTYPWRDLMPGWVGPDGRPLNITLKVTSADQRPLPSGIRMDRAWVLFGEQVWEFPVGGLKPGDDKLSPIKCPDSPVCEVSFGKGPNWGPGVYVDVVVRLTDSEGKIHLLQALNQQILSAS